MSDYISREQVIDVLKETGIIQDNDLGHLVVDEINRIPTLDEKEIIRKAFERVVERLDKQAGEFIDLSHRELSNNSIPAIKYLYKGFGVAKAIEIVKEECGISE